ncbi:MAG: D-2-hydroxyacid dehydrogenase [Dehalococcoidia bacterium]
MTASVGHVSSDMWHRPTTRALLDLIADLPALEWVHTSSAGVEGRAFRRLLERGVLLTNGSGANSAAIAHHVLALMLSHARRLPEYHAQQGQRVWKRLDGDELTDTTALIIGLGGIGRRVARLCHAFDMRTIGIRRQSESMPEVDRLLPPGELRAALAEADYVVLACPLTDETRGLIDAVALATMKPTAYLINVARGPVVVTEALVAALHGRAIGGAAVDVFDREPLPADSPLWDAPNLTLTPHAAGSSPYNPLRNAEAFLDNLQRFVAGQPLHNVVYG